MRRPVVAGNWKMHKLLAEAVRLVLDLKPRVVNSHHCEIVVAPPFTALKTICDRLNGSNIKVAAQDCSDQPGEGAFTGEVSAEMLKDIGCSYVIVAHSERRQFYGETNASANKKLRAALGASLIPIYCVGEDLAQRDAGLVEQIVEQQVLEGLSGLTSEQVSHIVIAYEPVWAIGTGRTATPEIASSVHGLIRSRLAKCWGREVAEQVRVLYGGSVKPENIQALMAARDIDGALVGGASLEAESFARIVNYIGYDR
ncbi:MAG: triose-phosphate isomerase [Acidobacteriota bacterium]|nr:triose-phosphate isomerase [Blastocatellia bacterium]MDW8412407.1 triose-phosphate isomerase [Acidobacteriota bacterium]